MRKRKEHITEDNVEKKHCPMCDTYKQLSDFTKQSSSWDGLCRLCAGCMNQYKKNKRLEDPTYKLNEDIYKKK